MAFTWILGRRFQPGPESLENKASGSHRQADHGQSQNQNGPISLADVKLSIEDGLVMAFGPEGDPVPPHLLKDASAYQPRAKLRLPDGKAVDHDRLIEVLEAQQRHPLAEIRSDRWVEAMLGVAGAFEPTPSELLAGEDSEDRRQSGGSLALDVKGGETLTICDTHPGNVDGAPHVQLRIGDQIVSIGDILGRSDRADAPGGGASMRLETSAEQEQSIILLFGSDAEALLETASDVWAGEPKAILLLSGGRQISTHDLTVMLQDETSLSSPLEKSSTAQSYPLLGDDEPTFDLERASIIMVTDLPDGWWLSSGMQSEQGAWILDPPDLSSASVHVAGPHEGPISLNIKVISLVGHDGTLVKQSRTIVMPPIGHGAEAEANSPAKHLDAKKIEGAQPSVTPLAFAPAEVRLAHGADALLLRGLPNDMSLSAGTYDPSIKGWILKPAQLDGLTVLDVDDATKEIVIELTAVHLEGKGRSRTEAIAKKTIIVGGESDGPEKMIA